MNDTPYLRRFIRIRAEDVPNVRRALKQIAGGQKPDGKRVLPGLMSWDEYQAHKATKPKSRQCVVLDAEWYEGEEEFLVTKDWLRFGNEYAAVRPTGKARRYMGVDSGGGGDKSCWVVGDRNGVLHLDARKTPDTNDVYGNTCHLARRWDVDWADIVFDFGGGGKQHVDRFHTSNLPVRGVNFGPIKRELRRGMTQFGERKDVDEDKAAFDSLRSSMAWDVRMLLERPVEITAIDPTLRDAMKWAGERPALKDPFALPLPMCEELCRQMSLIPLKWDALGKFKLMPKTNPNDPDDERTLKSIIGHSPDEFDAFCCFVYSMLHPPGVSMAGTL